MFADTVVPAFPVGSAEADDTADEFEVRLMWPNKDKFLLLPDHEAPQPTAPTWVERTSLAATQPRSPAITSHHGEPNQTDDPFNQNLLITADSADALLALGHAPELAPHYRGKVKAIYLDPPFNTGTTFKHYTDTLDRALWLSFIYDRLRLARDLLTEDGTIWVHLDDAETHRTRCLMDEVFGPTNFIADLTVEINPKGRQLDKFFAGSNDRVLVYAKDRAQADMRTGSTEDVNPADFPKTDQAGNQFRYLPLRNTNKKFNPTSARTMHFPIHGNPITGQVAMAPFPGSVEVWPVFGDLTPAVWRWSPPKVTAQANELECRTIGAHGRIDIAQRDYLGTDRTKKLKTIWPSGSIGSSDEGRRELKALDINGFDTPKPERLLRRIIEVATEPGDIVLDVFAGSGTTAAVAHKLGRRWVAAELRASTVAQFTEPRLRQVLDGTDQGGISTAVEWDGGGGYNSVLLLNRPSAVEPRLF